VRATFIPVRRAVTLAALGASLTIAGVARAVDPFEIQVYDATANAPGVPGLELHVNHVAIGLGTANAPELPQNGQTHFTLEPSIGLTPFWELGGYFQTSLRADGHFDYAGVKLRSKFVTPPRWQPHLRVGVNLELSLLPETYDRNRWGIEVRPIAAWENAHWLFAFNPIADTSLAGPDSSRGPFFEPALMAKWKLLERVMFGVEYYGSFGPIASPLPWSAEEQYLYEAVDLIGVAHLELNVAVGEGLTAASNAFVVKTIVGYEFGSDADHGAQARVPFGRFSMLR
jgi:hypothetical protein